MTDKNNIHPDQKARLEQPKSIRLRLYGIKEDVYFSSYPEGMIVEEQLDLYTLIDKVIGWHYDRNLIEGSTEKTKL